MAEEARAQRLVEPVITRYQGNRSKGIADPVLDFLFEYYKLRPKHLNDWSPGHGVMLDGRAAARLSTRKYFKSFGSGRVGLDRAQFPAHRVRSVKWIHKLLVATSQRPPFLGCNGMHEWAMVYGEVPVRHSSVPLRFDRETVNKIVDDNAIVCSHFDAFRFFSDQARGRNIHQPTSETMTELEQPGCLHANMDLYRWAGKLYPWISSALLVDAFLLAVQIREIDMRASPYDLSAFGLEAIAVETPAGKEVYRRHQLDFYEQGTKLRDRLIRDVGSLAGWLDSGF